jgi:hypothetical protein
MLIWDTGEYEVVEKKEVNEEPETGGEESEDETGGLSETEKLCLAFRNVSVFLMDGSMINIHIPRNHRTI